MLSAFPCDLLAQAPAPPSTSQPVSIAILIPVVLLAAALVFGLTWLFRRKAGTRRGAGEPTCGKCGYLVKGLTTFTCPECGSDLREVGIVGASLPAQARSANPSAPSAPITRTLTIMLTDMKDYTARVADLPRDQMLALVQHHRDLVQSVVRRRSGRVIKSTGDGLIISFDSATDALLAATEIQTASQDDAQPSFSVNHQLPLRIAVSTGEVTVFDNDVFGHPVNLASRVQQLAPAGEVYFTDSTYHAMNRSEIGYEPVGLTEIKGLAEKVNLYRALAPAEPKRK